MKYQDGLGGFTSIGRDERPRRHRRMPQKTEGYYYGDENDGKNVRYGGAARGQKYVRHVEQSINKLHNDGRFMIAKEALKKAVQSLLVLQDLRQDDGSGDRRMEASTDEVRHYMVCLA